MANLIALIIFIGSFAALAVLVFKKSAVLVNLPQEAPHQMLTNKQPIKQDILQKTALIKQAVLRNRGFGAVMAKTNQATSRFKTIFANRIATPEDMEKAEKMNQEGDYWQKVETHKFAPEKNKSTRKKKEIPPE